MIKANEIALQTLVRRHALSEMQTRQFVQYVELLEKWTSRANLVSTSDRDKIVSRHIADSLAVVQHHLIDRNGALLDVGAGAGFPGVPLALYFPQLTVTLLDSQRKKALFLRETVETIGLKNVTVVCGRLETLARDCGYDIITARAVARLHRLWTWSSPHLRTDGLLLAFKGGELDDELKELVEKESVSCRVEQLLPHEPHRKLVILARR
ncbi:16S rRNA (guanine(527)-N(7))-methyltransferase RsmG [candidate division KSB1 bacterium]|nr:16S rRNA (guanine(527)-N(7))-methyltransferase RsmG [candidate division KSB1 bacterium]